MNSYINHDYYITDLEFQGKRFNVIDVKAPNTRVAIRYAVIQASNKLKLRHDEYKRFLEYSYNNYAKGLLSVKMRPEQVSLFDNMQFSFKDIYNENKLMKMASLGVAILGGVNVDANIPDKQLVNLWGKYYQATSNPLKNQRALQAINIDFEIPDDADSAINTAVYIFGGDMGVKPETLKYVLVATGQIESLYKIKSQYNGGPAISYWQVEPQTAIDLWLNSRPLFGKKFKTAFSHLLNDLNLISANNRRNREIMSKLLLQNDDLAASFAAAKWIAAAHQDLKNI